MSPYPPNVNVIIVKLWELKYRNCSVPFKTRLTEILALILLKDWSSGGRVSRQMHIFIYIYFQYITLGVQMSNNIGFSSVLAYVNNKPLFLASSRRIEKGDVIALFLTSLWYATKLFCWCRISILNNWKNIQVTSLRLGFSSYYLDILSSCCFMVLFKSTFTFIFPFHHSDTNRK